MILEKKCKFDNACDVVLKDQGFLNEIDNFNLNRLLINKLKLINEESNRNKIFINIDKELIKLNFIINVIEY